MHPKVQFTQTYVIAAVLLAASACTNAPAPAAVGGTAAGDTAIGVDSVAAADGTAKSDTQGGGDAVATDTAAADSAVADGATTDTGPVGGDTISTAPVPLDKLAEAFAAAICSLVTKCDSLQDFPFATKEGCLSMMSGSGMGDMGDIIAAAKAGKVKYDPAKAGQCLASYAADCAAFGNDGEPEACKGVFTGTVATGSACTLSEMCVSQHCQGNTQSCPGKCAVKGAGGEKCGPDLECADGAVCVADKCAVAAPVKLGAACDQGQECEKGHYCHQAEEGKAVCAAQSAVDGKCFGSDACQDGLTCKAGADPKQPGVCAPKGKANEPCLASSSASPDPGKNPCAKGLVCVQESAAAGSCLPLAKVGEPCVGTAQCGGLDVVCQGATTKTCNLLPGKGGACKPADPTKGVFFTCLPPYYCDKTVCADPPGVGKPCAQFSLGSECADGLICANSGEVDICQQPPGNGEPCNGECKAGFTCEQQGGPGKCVAEVCK